jgi:hypothetical protein
VPEYLEDVPPAPGIDITRPHPARMDDYGLGGKNHFAADRAVADQVLAAMPALRTVARDLVPSAKHTEANLTHRCRSTWHDLAVNAGRPRVQGLNAGDTAWALGSAGRHSLCW